jgi:hypothetical protein
MLEALPLSPSALPLIALGAPDLIWFGTDRGLKSEVVSSDLFDEDGDSYL